MCGDGWRMLLQGDGKRLVCLFEIISDCALLDAR